jgi:cold shock CspA family protein/tetratricopeptide (TPR) repeat protein
MFPEEHLRFKPLAERAFEAWAPGVIVSYKALQQGLSGAAVVKADVRNAKTDDLQSGQYILKLAEHSKWANQRSEIEAHQLAYEFNVDFSVAHIPTLIKSFNLPGNSDELGGYAMLFEIAGNSLDAYAASDGRESSAFLETCGKVSTDLLNRWVEPEPTSDKNPYEILESWLDYRLDPSQAGALHDLTEEKLGSQLKCDAAGEIILNPLKFCEFAKTRAWSKRGYLSGILHGDLHGGNILTHRGDPTGFPYFLIDFGLAKEGTAGYDQAYMEVAQIVQNLRNNDAAYLVAILRRIDSLGDKGLLPDGTLWLKDCLHNIRNSISEWRTKLHPRRTDDVNRQFALARVAAGLNWANKPLTPNQQYLALCYAGWAAREFLKQFEPAEWNNLWLKADKPSSPAETAEENATDQSLWTELWNTVGNFSPRAGKFILVTEALEGGPRLRPLGQLPWSVVIDLDPSSDDTGLHRHAGPTIQSHRSLHTFSKIIPLAEFGRATAWMMAGGWRLKNEPTTDYGQWVYDKLHFVRGLIKAFDEAIDPDPIYVVVLPGGTLDPDMPMARLTKVVGAIDEMTRGRSKILLLGRSGFTEPLKHSHLPLDPDTFVSFVEKTFGFFASTDTAQVPSADSEWRAIPIESLRAMQENLEVLHSNILNDSATIGKADERGLFWQGCPPTWADFQAGDDIERSLQKRLMDSLENALDKGHQHTVILYHNPSAGGTTLAMRAAWDLRRKYPTALLTRWSPTLSVRLQTLFGIAQKTVLLVADASELPETAREDLYRDLAQRNTRIVVLYIRRVFQADGISGLALYDPMDRSEAKLFQRTYSLLTEDLERRQELSRITVDESLSRYRTPFFYGLVTFQRDFLPVDRYVASHIKDIGNKAREVIQYLALLTIYSNSGIHRVLLGRLMGLSGDVDLSLKELLGDGPSRLISESSDRVRLMHQVIAEEVLTCLTGAGKDRWRLELHHLSKDFIRRVTACVNPDSELVLEMFRQLFVDRPGSVDGVEDRQDFSRVIEDIDKIDKSLGHQVLSALTEYCPKGAHFWNHLGRHQIYRIGIDPEKAEMCLRQAVKLSPNDYIHFHTLGLVLRSRLRKVIHSVRGKIASEVLEAGSPLFNSAVNAFERSREINNENIHGYITHVQMILEFADSLKNALGVENIGELPESNRDVSDWIEGNIATAEKLLNDTQQLYGTLEQQSTYLTRCYADLGKLYGDIDQVIRLWELASLRDTGGAIGRRALANAYLARNQRRWTTLGLGELQRIVELMEDNLRSPGRRDEDYRLWFEAYKLLPEFEIQEAIAKLHLWASHFPSWRAYYYLYILHFYLWFSGRTDSINEMDEALEQCQKHIIGRKNFSSQWFGYKPFSCPLVSAADLAPWIKKGFWEDTSLLRAINGVVDDPIVGPQAGWILIDGKVRAFFVPAKDGFAPNQDENTGVHFFLGFSPVGLRAWQVAKGQVEDGDRVPYSKPKTFRVPVHLDFPPVPNPLRAQKLKSLRLARVLQFVDEYMRIKEELGAVVKITDLKKRAEATFGLDAIADSLGFSSFEELLTRDEYDLVSIDKDILVRRSEGTVAVKPKNGATPSKPRAFGQIVKLVPEKGFGFIDDGSSSNVHFRISNVMDQDVGKLRKGQIVEYSPELGHLGKIAIGVRVLEDSTLTNGAVIRPEELRDAVTSTVLSLLSDGVQMSVAKLAQILEREFLGSEPLEKRLQKDSLLDFLRGLNQLYFTGTSFSRAVGLRDARAFGRLASSDTSPPERPSLTKARAFAFKIVESSVAHNEHMSLPKLERELEVKLGIKGSLFKQLGYLTPNDFVSNIPEFELYVSKEGDTCVRFNRQKGMAAPAQKERVKNDLATAAKPFIIELTREAETSGNPLKVVSVAGKLIQRFQVEGSVAKALGTRSFLEFLNSVKEVEVFLVDAEHYVRFRK